MEIEPTDKRIDDLNARMAEGFGLVHREIDGLDARMTEGFKRVDADIRELRGDVKSVQRTMIYGFLTLSGIMVSGFLTLAGLQIF